MKIKIPGFDLTELTNYIYKNINLTNYQQTDLQQYYLYYDFANTFINKLQNIVAQFFLNNDSVVTFTYINDLNTYIRKYIGEDEFIQYFTIIDYYFNNNNITTNVVNTQLYKNASLYQLINLVLTYIYQDYNVNDYSYNLFKYTINANMDILTNLNTVLFNILQSKYKPNIPIKLNWINKLAIYLIDSIQLTIGSNIITTFTPNYIDIYGQLYYQNNEIYDHLIGSNTDLNLPNVSQPDTYLYLPIPFWFATNYGLALPLIALQYNTLQIKIKFKKFIDCIGFTTNITDPVSISEINNAVLSKTVNIFTSSFAATMLLEYIYLDNIERKKFAQSSHEYLITQVQEITFDNVTPLNNKFELDLFHCCKEIYWSAIQYSNLNNIFTLNNFDNYTIDIPQPIYSNNNSNYVNYLNIVYNPTYLFDPYNFMTGLQTANTIISTNNDIFNSDINSAILNSNTNFNYTISPINESSILLNSVTLINQPFSFFNYLEPYNYFLNAPDKGINIYSFSLNPTDSQPSGSCNLSRIPKTTLSLTIIEPNSDLIITNVNSNNYNNQNALNYKLYVQAVNYNILRFIGGIVGVAYTY